jgi:hypothetical protein
MRWLHPGRRIDYVLGPREKRDGRGRVTACFLALTEPDGNGVFASDHWAVVADVQL